MNNSKSTSRWLLAANVMLAATMSTPAASAADYSRDEALKTLYVNVESDGTGTLPTECISLLKENAVTNLVKKGGGKLSVSEDLTSYTGHITVAEGI